MTPRRSTSPSSVLPARSSASAPPPSSKISRKQGKHANVVNFALPGAGRDIQWAILNELFKAKSPKVVVLEVEEQPYPFGHFLFKYVAPAEAIVFPPSPFLHNYLYNLAYLPVRKVKLFGANLFPDLFGLTKEFDPEHYAKKPHRLQHELHRRRQAGRHGASGSTRDPPRSAARAGPTNSDVARRSRGSTAAKITFSLEKIAREAKAHGAQLLFVHLPMFEGPQTVSDADFLKQFGPVLNYGDLAPHDELFENWSHLNHAGAMNASARLADAIGGLER